MKEEKKKGPYWAVITAPVLYHKNLSDKSKLLYATISNLTHRNGYCNAHNEHFTELFGWPDRTVRDCMKQLEDEGFIQRVNNYIGKEVSARKIYLVHPQESAGHPGSTLPPAPAADCRHNDIINDKDNTSAIAGSDFFNDASQAVAHEIESKVNWDRLTSLWQTSESGSVLKSIYKKYFKPLSKEEQESILKMIQDFGSDVQYLKNVWIGKTFKEELMDKESLQKDIDRAKQFHKPKSKTDDIRRISNF